MLLLLLLLSRFSCVRPCATPETAAHQVPIARHWQSQNLHPGPPQSKPCHSLTLKKTRGPILEVVWGIPSVVPSSEVSWWGCAHGWDFRILLVHSVDD